MILMEDMFICLEEGATTERGSRNKDGDIKEREVPAELRVGGILSNNEGIR